MERQKLLQRNIWIFRITTWVGKNGFTLSVIYFFLTQIKSQEPTAALFLISLSSLAKSLTEVPTGVVADKFSRKHSLQIGFLIMAIAWILLLLLQGFSLLAMVMLVRGIGSSFVSGADDSLLYDSLKELKKASDFKNKLNVSKVYDLLIFAGVVTLSGHLAAINLHIPIIISIFCTFIASFICLLFVEPAKSEIGEEIEHSNYLVHAWKSIRIIFSLRSFISGVALVFLSTALIDAVLASNKNILSPIFENYGLSVSLVGKALSVVFISKAIGAYVASKLNKEGGELKEIGVSLIIYILGLVILLSSRNAISALILFAIIAALDPLIRSNLLKLLNDIIPSSKRSTILSLLSVAAESTETLFLVLFGWLLSVYSLSSAVLMTIVWVSLVGIMILWLGLQTQKSRQYFIKP